MLRLLATFVCTATIGLFYATSASAALWSPKNRPESCTQENIEAVLIDTSQSMQEDGLFNPLNEKLVEYLRSIPLNANHCHHLILMRFDLTADVLIDSYLLSEEERNALIATLSQIQANGTDTNFDEAAKLIRLVWLQLRRDPSTDVPRTFSVRVLTDGKSDPSQNKVAFDLGDFLRQEFGTATQYQVGIIDVAPVGSAIAPPDPLEPVYRVTVPMEAISGFFQQTQQPPQPPQAPAPPRAEPLPTSSASPVAPVAPLPEPKPEHRLPWLIFYITGTAVAIGVGAAVAIALRKKPSSPEAVSSQTLLESAKSLDSVHPVKYLRVSESQVSFDGGQPEILRNEERVLLGLGIPAKFGTNADAAYNIRDLPGAIDLFSVTALPEGQLQIFVNHPAVFFNDQLVLEKGCQVAAYEAFKLNYQQREWQIEPAYDDPYVLVKAPVSRGML